MRHTLTIALSVLIGTSMSGIAQSARAPSILAPQEIVLGEAPNIEVVDVKPAAIVRVHSLRRTEVWSNEAGKYSEHPVIVHGWADYRADRNGKVLLDSALPLAGTYVSADQNGLLWSGWPEGDPRLADGGLDRLQVDPPADDNTLVLVLVRQRAVEGSRRIQLVHYSRQITFTELNVAKDGVSGVFAAPGKSRGNGAVILLHGSEGGTMDAARSWAGSMAEQGFPALALNYMTYARIDGVPDAMANLPVETLDHARQWLSSRPNVEARKIALVGASKGAEFALVGASQLSWVQAVVACVPSDVVWAGYGRAVATGEKLSSWSLNGKPLPFIAYDRYEDVFTGKAAAAEVHNRSRAKATAAEIAAARIPVERIRGHILLFGAGKDEVWPSEAMVGNIAQELRDSGHSGHFQEHLFPGAGHSICGTGTAPVRATGIDRSSNAIAAGQTFRETVSFLKRWLQ